MTPEKKSCLTAALWYAANGWSVLVCHWPEKKDDGWWCSCGKPAGEGEGKCKSAGKHPLTKHGVKDATKDPEIIKGWFEKWPLANVGLAMGLPCGMWALDIDPRHDGDESIREAQKKYSRLPSTPQCLTGSGGQHYFFALPSEIVLSNRAGILPGVDVRTDGGFVVTAPSLHVSGRYYEWEIDSRPEAFRACADAPGWLLDLALGRTGAAPAGSAPGGKPGAAGGVPLAPELPDEIREGGRDNAMASLAGTMCRRGTSEDGVLALLRVENAKRCKPPLDDSDLIRIAKIAGRYQPGDPVTGDLTSMPLEDRSTVGLQILKELCSKQPDDLLLALEDRRTISALVAVRRLEPGMFAAGMERINPRTIRTQFERVTKAGIKQDKGRTKKDTDDPRPEICISTGDLEAHVAAAVDYLLKANEPPAPRTLYSRAAGIVRVRAEDGVPRIETLKEKAIVEALGQAIHWTAKRSTEEESDAKKDVYPPVEVANSILYRPGLDLPRLSMIYTHPVFAPALDHNNPIRLLAGYHAPSGTLVCSPNDWTLPETATVDEGKAALKWMLDEVFCDFPFDGQAERATAVALALVPFVRPLIEGCVPMYLIEASAPGSGKGLLADVALAFATGGIGIGITSQEDDEDGWKKKITSLLLTGFEAISIDNATGYIDSSALNAVLTTPHWTDRKMMTSDAIICPAKAIWCMTANNLSLSPDLTRRIVRCRLVPKSETPYKIDLTKYRHQVIRKWIKEKRAEMLKAAWTCCAAWATAGCPLSDTPILGTYESWSMIMGGILNVLGFEGFLMNRDQVMESSDRDSGPMKQFVNIWFLERRDDVVTSEDLLPFAMRAEIGVRGNDDNGRKRSLSWLLNSHRDRIYRGWQISKERAKDSSGRTFWQIKPVTEAAQEELKNAPARPNMFPDREDREPAF